MRIEFLPHALQRMVERRVTREQVIAVVEAPMASVPAVHGRVEHRGMIERDGRPMLLRVIVEQGVVVTVVTVIATSKLSKDGVSL